MIEGTFRYDSSCLPNKTKDDSKGRNNRKQVKKSKSMLFNDSKWAIGNDDIFSYHYINENTNIIIHNMILNLCE